METFRHFPCGADHLAADALVRSAVFQHQTRIGGKAVLEYNGGALRVDAQRKSVQGRRIPLKSDVNFRADAQEHALAALTIMNGRD